MCSPRGTTFSLDLKWALDNCRRPQWHLGWHFPGLVLFLKQQNIQDPAIHAVVYNINDAIQEPCKTLASEGSSDNAVSRRMVLDSPAWHGWQSLEPQILASPYVGTNLFSGSFTLWLTIAICERARKALASLAATPVYVSSTSLYGKTTEYVSKV